MPTQRSASCLAVFLIFPSLITAACGETLTFFAQYDPTLGATNYSWFSPNNWWVNSGAGLEPSGRVPLANETAVVTGSVDGGLSGIRVGTLVLTNGATVMNGTFSAEQLELQSDSAFVDARVNVLGLLRVGGTNCALNGSTLTVLGIGAGLFSPLPPAKAATLTLDRGSVLWNAGSISLKDQTQILTLGPPQSRLVIAPGCVFSASGTTTIRGSASNPLVIDNSGVVRVEGGALTFEDGIQWQSSSYSGEFRAVDANSHVVFASPMQVPAEVTDLFTGAGTNYLLAGAIVDGLAQVGVSDTNAPALAAGNLVVDASVSGTGRLQVVASPAYSGVVTWNNGTLSLPEINIAHGAQMFLAGDAWTSRQLSGCSVNSSGVCTMLSPGVSFLQGASFNNLPDGIFEVQGDGVFSGTPMPNGGQFNNAGLFRKLSPGDAIFGTNSLAQGPDFNNFGLVELLGGSLRLLGGASSGLFHTATGATLWFWGGTHRLTGVEFMGDGAVKLMQGAAPPTWQVDGDIAVAKLELGTNGTVVGHGKSSPSVIIDSLVARDNGTVSNAQLIVNNLQTLDNVLVENSSLTVSGSFVAQGTKCQLAGSSLTLLAQADALLSPMASGAAATLNLSQGSVLEISGRLTLQNNASVIGDGLPQNRLILNSAATVNCTNSAVVEASAPHHLLIDSTGVFRAVNGTLVFNGGIDWQSSGGLARFDTASRTGLVLFAHDFRFPPQSFWVFTGPGTNRFEAPGTVDGVLQVGMVDPVSHSLIPGNAELSGDLDGSGTLHVLGSTPESGACVWSQGKLSVAAVHVGSDGKFLIAGDVSSSRELSGSAIRNSGLLLWPGPPVSAGAGAAVVTLPGGTLDISGDAKLTFNNTPPRMVLNNYGTVIKSGGTGFSTIHADFTNSASLEVRTGALRLDGAVVQDAGTTTVNHGAIFGAPAFTVQGGTVSGTGLIDANVVNRGTFSPGTPIGLLSLSPETDFQQHPGGALLIEIGGPDSSSTYDQLGAGRSAQLAGDLALVAVNGFVPQPGQAFRVLTCSSLSGAFARILGTTPPGTAWVARYTATNATVLLASEVSLSAPVVSDGVLSLPFSTTPGLTYVVQACDSLAAPIWQTVASFNGDGLPKTFREPASLPLRFFRVLIR